MQDNIPWCFANLEFKILFDTNKSALEIDLKNISHSYILWIKGFFVSH